MKRCRKRHREVVCRRLQFESLEARQLLTATVEGRAWFDQSGDGERAWVSFPEYELSDVTVNLLNEAGQLLASTETNEVGRYAFQDLAPGRYMVEFIAPDGTQFTLQNQGKNSRDSDVGPQWSDQGLQARRRRDSGRCRRWIRRNHRRRRASRVWSGTMTTPMGFATSARI